MKVSFVLPCYNVAPYVGRCIESIMSQDFPENEFDVICVDDCSTDNTIEVIEQYQKKYSNVLCFKHLVNKTSGGARNTGMKYATGEYLWFVDPDDSVPANVLGFLYDRAKHLDTDLLFFNITQINEDGTSDEIRQLPTIDCVMPGPDFVTKYLPAKHLAGITSIYRCLYRREFCCTHNLHYPEIKSSQDVVFIWKCILEADKVSSISQICYNYHRRLNSMTGQKGVFKSYATLSSSLLFPNEVQGILDYYGQKYPYFVKDLEFCIRTAINDNSRKVMRMRWGERRKFYKSLKDNVPVINRLHGYMNRKTKMIFNCNIPFFVWNSIMTAYSLK